MTQPVKSTANTADLIGMLNRQTFQSRDSAQSMQLAATQPSDSEGFEINAPLAASPTRSLAFGCDSVNTTAIGGVRVGTKLTSPTQLSELGLTSETIQDLLFLRPIDPSTEAIVSYGDTRLLAARGSRSGVEHFEPVYVLDVMRRDRAGWFLARRIKIERNDLSAYEQKIFARKGQLLVTAYYTRQQDQQQLRWPCRVAVAEHKREAAPDILPKSGS